MEQDVALVSLVLLGQVLATVTLSVSILVIYRNSPAMKHVWPLALSYLWLLGVAAARAALLQVVVPWVQWNVVGAFALGDVGLIVLLSRSWPKRQT